MHGLNYGMPMRMLNAQRWLGFELVHQALFAQKKEAVTFRRWRAVTKPDCVRIILSYLGDRAGTLYADGARSCSVSLLTGPLSASAVCSRLPRFVFGFRSFFRAFRSFISAFREFLDFRAFLFDFRDSFRDFRGLLWNVAAPHVGLHAGSLCA